MNKQKPHIIWFKNLTIDDVPIAGGKNAALGEMISRLKGQGIKIPNGFAITAHAYRYFINSSLLDKKIKAILAGLDTRNVNILQKRGKEIRKLILGAKLPDELQRVIIESYRELEKEYGKNADVAVRSSATAEDLPTASFAGQQETYLNVVGAKALLESVKKCFASLFTDRAISYRADKGFSHADIALSVGVQKMIRSDLAVSGVMFSLDTETGFDKVVVINAAYGLGETLVGGEVIPDEFIVFKSALELGYSGIITKKLGDKTVKVVYSKKGTKKISVPKEKRDHFCITDKEARILAGWAIAIEKYFSDRRHIAQAMDIEWAKDGRTGELFIVQARPETIHTAKSKDIYTEYRLIESGEYFMKGIAIGTKIAAGIVRVVQSPEEIKSFKKGEVLVAEITDPDWEPIMKIANAIVTNKGGRTSHAAIVSRELGIPAIVGTRNATKKLKNGQKVTIDCSSGKEGIVYEKELKFKAVEHRLDKLPETRTKVMVNIGSPDEALKNYYLPVKGVGLGRLEFIISSYIKIHPQALIKYSFLKDKTIIKKIDELTRGYKNKKQYYIDKLSEGIAKIGAAFWPHEVIIRFSDFKTNEYRALVGGELYEPNEENPMIGWRGASRYYDEGFKKAFELECKAIKRVRDEIGLKNVVVMVPFCRTIEEGVRVIEIMKKYGLDKNKDREFRIYVMCEIPSNVLLADKFLEIFDGMSIGSNDLTQLVLGLDRDSNIISHIGNENNPAVKKMISDVIYRAKAKRKYIGICGQAPSDFPEFARFLVSQGIESISLNPDTVIKTLPIIADQETRLRNKKKRVN